MIGKIISLKFKCIQLRNQFLQLIPIPLDSDKLFLTKNCTNDQNFQWPKPLQFKRKKKVWKFSLKRLESIVGKPRNTDYQHFLIFPQC